MLINPHSVPSHTQTAGPAQSTQGSPLHSSVDGVGSEPCKLDELNDAELKPADPSDRDEEPEEREEELDNEELELDEELLDKDPENSLLLL